METKTNYIISRLHDDTRLESLSVCGIETLAKDWQFYTVERGYVCVIHKIDFCSNCGGSSKVAKTRGKKKLFYQYKECPECKGKDFPEVDVTDWFTSLEKVNG